jgi:hypothetical protein
MLGARDHRALERCLAPGLEKVHEGTERGLGFRAPEEIGPGLVRIDDDALMDVRDRVDGPGHEGFELPLVLVRGLQCLVERALEPVRAQLALRYAAQPLGLAERHEVLRACEQRVGDVGFFGRLADDYERNRTRRLLLDLRDLADRSGQTVGEEAEKLGLVLVERARERVDLGDPKAADRMAAVPEGAVHELDVVLATAKDNQRYRSLGSGHAGHFSL